jgi:hypothetical protein
MRPVPQQEAFSYDSGNNEPKRGFGHIAVFCNGVCVRTQMARGHGTSHLGRAAFADVYATCDRLEAAGVSLSLA